MKQIEKSLLLLAMLFTVLCAQAQVGRTESSVKPPRWCSDKGYWVMESNVKTPDQSTVSFYRVDGKLIYVEKVKGVVLDCSKRKTLMKLKRVLEKVVDSYQADGEVKTSGELTT